METFEEVLRRIRGVESGNNPLAKAKTSSAGGLYQFTTGTMASVLKRMDPDTYGGKSNAELAKFKFDPNVSEQAAQFHLNRDIIPKLEKSGVPVTPGSIYASWFLGPAGAVKTFQADPGTKISNVAPEAVGPNAGIRFQGKKFGDWTTSDLVNWAESKMGGPAPAATAAPAQAPTGFGGQVANFLFGPPPARSPDAFAIDAPPGLIAQATGGLIGGGRAEPFSVGFDTPRPYQPAFVEPQQQYGAAFAGSAPDMSGGSATLTSLPPTISAAPAAGVASGLASLGSALAKAGAAKEDMSWVQRELPAHRGKWDDEIFKRSIFGIRGLLG